MTPFVFTLICLVVWRISSLLAREQGPWGVLAKFRDVVGVKYDEKSVAYGTNEFAKSILCVWCSSLWLGGAASFIIVRDWTFLLWAFAISAVAIIIDHIVAGE